MEVFGGGPKRKRRGNVVISSAGGLWDEGRHGKKKEILKDILPKCNR
jgi:hypothetical protein